jgi:Methyltransferase domain
MLAGGVVVSDAQRSARGTRVGDIDLPAVFGSIGITRDYSRLDLEGLNVDLQGWGSEHRIFDRVLVESRPQVVMEVGTWKGASVLNMVAIARREGLTTEFICVDTWLGGDDQWIDNERRAELRLEGGYPTLFKQFVCNLVAHDATEAVFPLPLSSPAAARLLNALGITADVVYVDAAHSEAEAALDLALYWKLVRPGGVIFGHDYDPGWPGVVRAVDRFVRQNRLELEFDFPMCSPGSASVAAVLVPA